MTMEALERLTKFFGAAAPVMLSLLFTLFWITMFRPEKRRSDLIFLLTANGLFLLLMESPIPTDLHLIFSPGMLLLLLLNTGYCMLFHRASWEKAVFQVIFVYSIHAMAWLISQSVLELLTDVGIGRIDPERADFERRLYLVTGINLLLWMLLLALLYLAFWLIFRRKLGLLDTLSVPELCFLISPHIVGIIFARLMASLLVVPLENEVFILYDEARDALWKGPLMALVLLIGEYMQLYIFRHYRQFLRERQRVLSREEQLRQMRSRLSETDRFYADMRRVRHDLRNHITVLQGLLADGSYDEARRYMERLDEASGTLPGELRTGNPVCDVVLRDKCKQAEEAQIPMRVSFFYTEEQGISPFDMGILLGNLLDNAIEATCRVPKERRLIELSLRSRGPCLLLEVKNTFGGTLRISEDDGLPLSDKDGSLAEHGIGLRSVREIAESYLGCLKIRVEGDVFIAEVMLQGRAMDVPA